MRTNILYSVAVLTALATGMSELHAGENRYQPVQKTTTSAAERSKPVQTVGGPASSTKDSKTAFWGCNPCHRPPVYYNPCGGCGNFGGVYGGYGYGGYGAGYGGYGYGNYGGVVGGGFVGGCNNGCGGGVIGGGVIGGGVIGVGVGVQPYGMPGYGVQPYGVQPYGVQPYGVPYGNSGYGPATVGGPSIVDPYGPAVPVGNQGYNNGFQQPQNYNSGYQPVMTTPVNGQYYP